VKQNSIGLENVISTVIKGINGPFSVVIPKAVICLQIFFVHRTCYFCDYDSGKIENVGQ
jgi:hypothetical protein